MTQMSAIDNLRVRSRRLQSEQAVLTKVQGTFLKKQKQLLCDIKPSHALNVPQNNTLFAQSLLRGGGRRKHKESRSINVKYGSLSLSLSLFLFSLLPLLSPSLSLSHCLLSACLLVVPISCRRAGDSATAKASRLL